MPCHAARGLAKAVCALAPSTARWADVLRVIRATPEYGVSFGTILGLLSTGTIHSLAVYLAGWDVVHSAHLAYWRAAEQHVNARRGKRALRAVFLPRRTHWGLCADPHASLRLHLDPELWHEGAPASSRSSAPPAAPSASPPPPRARL